MAQSSMIKMLINNNKRPNEDGDTAIITNLKSYNKPNFYIIKNTAKPSRVVRKDGDDGSDVSTIKHLLINRYFMTPVTTMVKIQGNCWSISKCITAIRRPTAPVYAGVPWQQGNNDSSSYTRRKRKWNLALLNLGLCASAASRKFLMKRGKQAWDLQFTGILHHRYVCSKPICVKQSLIIHETFQHGKQNLINLTNLCHEIITCVLYCISKKLCWYRLTNLRVNALPICDASQLVPVLLSIWSFWSSCTDTQKVFF